MPPRLTLSQALAQKIRELLAEQGWSQRDFAERLGVTQGTVSYWLSVKRRQTALDVYEQLAAQFGLPLSRLFAELEGRVAAARLRPTRRRPGREKGESPDAAARVFVTSANYDRTLEQALRLFSRAAVDALWADYQARLQDAPEPNGGNGDVEPDTAHGQSTAGSRTRRGTG